MLTKEAYKLQGIPKVLLRNAIPADKAKDVTDDYEVTPEYVYNWNEKEQRVETSESAPPPRVRNEPGINKIVARL